MTIREFAKLNNFPIKGKLTRIPDEVEYDFNDQPHNCKRYVDEDFNEYGIHEDGFIVAGLGVQYQREVPDCRHD